MGEFLILLGVFKAKLAIAVIAFSGVVMASVYALRLFIRAMHNRVRDGVDSREIALLDSTVLVPLVAVIIFFAVYPQLALSRSEGSVKAAVAPARAAMAPTALAGGLTHPVTPTTATEDHSATSGEAGPESGPIETHSEGQGQ